jgi:hypothetical protein
LKIDVRGYKSLPQRDTVYTEKSILLKSDMTFTSLCELYHGTSPESDTKSNHFPKSCMRLQLMTEKERVPVVRRPPGSIALFPTLRCFDDFVLPSVSSSNPVVTPSTDNQTSTGIAG